MQSQHARPRAPQHARGVRAPAHSNKHMNTLKTLLRERQQLKDKTLRHTNSHVTYKRPRIVWHAKKRIQTHAPSVLTP